MAWKEAKQQTDMTYREFRPHFQEEIGFLDLFGLCSIVMLE